MSSTPPLCTKLTIELFAIQLLETFHKFSTLLLNFDSIDQFFFETVGNLMAHLPKMFLSIQIVAIMHHKQETSNLRKVGSEKWVGKLPALSDYDNL